jgi:hypothetical protein
MPMPDRGHCRDPLKSLFGDLQKSLGRTHFIESDVVEVCY